MRARRTRSCVLREAPEPHDADAPTHFTRLTNAFSKKAELHAHAVAIHFMWYNFVKIHQTLEVTPAMAVGVTNRLWEAEDVIRLLPDAD